MDTHHTVSRASTSSNGGVGLTAGWKYLFGEEDVKLLFFKAQTLQEFIIARVVRNLLLNGDFLAGGSQRGNFGEKLLLR